MTTDTMNTGDVSRRMDIPVTAEKLASLGFKPAGQDKRATLWAQSDYPAMCKAVAKYIESRAGVPMQPKPETKPKVKPETKPTNSAPVDDDDEL